MNNSFAGRKLCNFKRNIEVYSEDKAYLVKLDKNGQVYDVGCASFGVSKKGNRYLTCTPVRIVELYHTIKGRPWCDKVREIILNWEEI